jgi:hypothetical protein
MRWEETGPTSYRQTERCTVSIGSSLLQLGSRWREVKLDSDKREMSLGSDANL